MPSPAAPFGPEGGLAVTAVLLVSCGLVWLAEPETVGLNADSSNRNHPPF